MPPHSHYSPPEEIAIIEAAGKIPRNRERERRSADNARLPAAWPFQLHRCLPPPCHIFHSDKRGGRGWAGSVGVYDFKMKHALDLRMV